VTAAWTVPPVTGGEHLAALTRALRMLEPDVDRLWGWALALADVLQAGGRLLAVGNGGSAAQAQHLTSELVGRYCNDRHPFSAISLHADTSSVTAISNDYGVDAIFARQVLAHGRRGDVLIALSTSGQSPNVVTAAEVAMTAGLKVWALTGPGPNPLASCAHNALCIQATTTATIQEVHLVVVHLLCSFLDEIVGCGGAQ
jgi:D-sedoheptulose 7-phosphate isomerase